MKQILLLLAIALACGACARLIGLEEPRDTIDSGAPGDGAATVADGGLSSSPDAGALSPDDRRRVFVTSGLYTGALGGLSGADQICQTEAANAGLVGNWIAWLADDTNSPLTRFVQGRNNYELLDGTVIAESWDDLVDGSLLAAINLTPISGLEPPFPETWTNVASTGQLVESLPSGNCDGWTDSSDTATGRIGENDRSDPGWTVIIDRVFLCASTLLIYCFER